MKINDKSQPDKRFSLSKKKLKVILKKIVDEAKNKEEDKQMTTKR
jgi:hypothetical protein